MINVMAIPPENCAGSTETVASSEDSRAARAEAVITVIRETETVLRQALAQQLDAIAEAEQLDAHTLAGARSVKVWLSRLLNIDEAEAKTRTLVAHATTPQTAGPDEETGPELPTTAEALRSGAITVSHARAIADGMGRLSSECSGADRADAEHTLAVHAKTTTPRKIATHAEYLRHQLDHAGALRDEQYQINTRELHYAVDSPRSAPQHPRLP